MDFARSTFRTAAIAIAVSLSNIGPAAADDFVIDGNTTETNGGNVIDGDDTLTVTETGSITVSGDAKPGVSATGQNNRIDNLGTITSAGIQSYGIRAQNGQNAASNSGSVTTTGLQSHAIWFSGGSNTIGNSGSLSTGAANSDGIFASGGSNSISNSGSIATTAADSAGIRASAGGNTIVNSGSIGTLGLQSFGIRATGGGNTITNSGTVSTAGAEAHGIDAPSGNDTISNGGTIATTGAGSHGILGDNDNTIENSGTITTTGTESQGIRAVDGGSTITSSGSIATTGGLSHGIRASGGGTTVVNSGTITTDGIDADGIRVSGGGNTVSNTSSDSISTTKADSDAIRASGGNSTVNNSGSIRTQGAAAFGIWASGGGNTVTSSGSIHTSGAGSDAILVTAAGNSVAVSGSVVSEQANAVHLNGANAVLALLPGAALQGGLTFSDPGTGTLNLNPGMSAHLTFNGLPATINSGALPVVVDGSVVALVDVTGFAATDQAFFDLSRTAANTLDARMGGLRPGGQTFAYGGGPGSPHGAWASLIGAYRDQDATSTTAAYDIALGGIIGGADRALSASRSAGFYGGYTYADISASGDGTSTDANSVFAGGYFSHTGASHFIDFAGLLGISFYDNRRRVINNAVAGGFETATADYNGYFLSPSLTIGTNTQLFGKPLTPSIRLRYAALFLDGYTESGSSANLSVGSRTAHFGEIRGQLAYRAHQAQTSQGAMETVLRAGVDGIFNWGDDVSATLLGQSVVFAPGDQDAIARGFVGADFVFAGHGGRTSATAGFEVGYGTDNAFTGEARVGFRRRF